MDVHMMQTVAATDTTTTPIPSGYSLTFISINLYRFLISMHEKLSHTEVSFQWVSH